MAPSYEEALQGGLAGKPADELRALEQQIMQAFEDADNADDLDAMAAAADALDQVRAALSEEDGEDPSIPESAEPVEPAVAASGAVTADGGEAPAEVPVEATTDEAPAEPDADDTAADTESADGEPEATDAPAEDTNQEEPEMGVEIPAERLPVAAAALPVTITAGADIPGVSAGTEYSSLQALSEAMVRKIGAVSRGAGGNGEYVVATVASAVPSDRMLSSGNAEENLAKALEVVSPQAITAAGGWCAPLEVRYDVFGLGVADRPVRDAFPTFGADRGGIRFPTPPTLTGGNYANATVLWTAANDASPGAPATKPVLTATCAAEQTVTVDAITMQIKFGNLMTRAYPELVTRHMELGLIAQANRAEDALLTKLSAGSTALTSAYALGTSRDFLVALTRASTAYRSRHRMKIDTPLRVIAPNWVRKAMLLDISLGLPGDQMDRAQQLLDAYLSTLNINVSWHMQNGFGAEVAATAVDDFPATFDWYIFAEGTWLFLDGGTLDLGVVRDATLVGTNDYIQFTETFEGLAKIGIESIKVTTTTHIAGAIAGSVNTQGGAGVVTV
jgi:hypothetical protein